MQTLIGGLVPLLAMVTLIAVMVVPGLIMARHVRRDMEGR